MSNYRNSPPASLLLTPLKYFAVILYPFLITSSAVIQIKFNQSFIINNILLTLATLLCTFFSISVVFFMMMGLISTTCDILRAACAVTGMHRY